MAGNSKTNPPKNVGYNKLSSHDEYLLDEKNGNVVPGSQKNVKDKFDIIDLNSTSDFEEELTEDSDYVLNSQRNFCSLQNGAVIIAKASQVQCGEIACAELQNGTKSSNVITFTKTNTV
ncbi:hypothetical protein V9T40_010826 [Parthenolecanium corni]|uniref:Uncharacterized protein n=1 Tax=Parthenolecanium corni TaxID=536013 RepID=A0AAN9T6T8_9HEMI